MIICNFGVCVKIRNSTEFNTYQREKRIIFSLILRWKFKGQGCATVQKWVKLKY